MKNPSEASTLGPAELAARPRRSKRGVLCDGGSGVFVAHPQATRRRRRHSAGGGVGREARAHAGRSRKVRSISTDSARYIVRSQCPFAAWRRVTQRRAPPPDEIRRPKEKRTGQEALRTERAGYGAGSSSRRWGGTAFASTIRILPGDGARERCRSSGCFAHGAAIRRHRLRRPSAARSASSTAAAIRTAFAG